MTKRFFLAIILESIETATSQDSLDLLGDQAPLEKTQVNESKTSTRYRFQTEGRGKGGDSWSPSFVRHGALYFFGPEPQP